MIFWEGHLNNILSNSYYIITIATSSGWRCWEHPCNSILSLKVFMEAFTPALVQLLLLAFVVLTPVSLVISSRDHHLLHIDQRISFLRKDTLLFFFFFFSECKLAEVLWTSLSSHCAEGSWPFGWRGEAIADNAVSLPSDA